MMEEKKLNIKQKSNNKGKQIKNQARGKRRQRGRKNRGKTKNQNESASFVRPPSTQKAMINFIPDAEERKKWEGFIQLFKATGPDLRMQGSSNSVGGMLTDTATSTIKIVNDVDAETLYAVAVSVLSHAGNHGFRQYCMQQGQEAYPYYAFLFIYNALLSVAAGNQNEVPKIQFPDFLLEIIAAISPKEGALIGAGLAGYSWNVVNSSTIPNTSFMYPSSGTQYGNMTFYVTTNNTYLNYQVMVSPTVSYTTQLGAQAFTSLVNFMSGKNLGARDKYHPYKKKDFELKGTYLERSMTAFATTSRNIGGGVKGGYPYTIASSEVYLTHPKFGCFSANVPISRGFRFHKQTGGDANWLVASILLQQLKGEYGNPNYPAFQPVDFNECAHRVATVMVKVFNLYYADNINSNRIANLGITWWDYLIMLRKILMKNFSSTQYGVQSMRFYYNDNDDFIPFLCNSGGTCSSNTTAPKLPLFAVENLNSLRARCMYPNINPVTKDQIDKYPKMFVPVLGIYTKSNFEPSQYTYSTGQGNVNIFLAPGTSVNVNLVDCQLDQKFVDLDTSPYINTVIAAWNNAMDVLGMYIQQPREVTGDPGINVLSVIGDAWFVEEQAENPVVIQRPVKKEEKKKPRDKGKKKKIVSSSDDEDVELLEDVPQITVYQKLVRAYISQQVPIIDIVPIKKAMWLPEWKFYVNSQNPAGNITVDTIRSLNLLCWQDNSGVQYVASGEGDYSPMQTLREQFVAHCVKNRDADDDSTIKVMQQLGEAGKAGLLGDLVGTFGGEVASNLIRTAASFIPI